MSHGSPVVHRNVFDFLFNLDLKNVEDQYKFFGSVNFFVFYQLSNSGRLYMVGRA